MSALDKLKEMADKMPCYSHTFNSIINQLESAQQRIAELEDFDRVDMKLKRVIANRLEGAQQRIAELEAERTSTNTELARIITRESNRAIEAEAELARRDQAAGEPVAVVGSDFSLFWAGSGPIGPIIERHNIKVGARLFTAAQPSALPPEYALTVDFNDYHLGWNSCLNAAKALGAHQEKVVVLEDVESDAILNAWDYRSMVIAALDAAGVKWKEA